MEFWSEGDRISRKCAHAVCAVSKERGSVNPLRIMISNSNNNNNSNLRTS